MSKEQTKFIVRLVLFIVFGCILPFTFIAWQYEIFKAKPTALTGWGFIAMAIITIFTIHTCNSLRKCFPYTMFSQCVSGFMVVILPLTLLLMLVNGIKENINAFINALTITILCECVAIPLNPIPHFMKVNQIARDNARMDTFFTKFKDSWQEANKPSEIKK